MVSFGLLPGVTMCKALELWQSVYGFELPFQLKYLGTFVALFHVSDWLF